MTKNTSEIKVGFLISYDYMYIKDSLPRVYAYADSISFAVDKDRKTWSGESFDIPDSFFDWVKEFDKDNKIRIYEDSFSVPTLTAMECETRERNMLARFMGEGGWHIQIDSDEYFLDFRGFINFLSTLDLHENIQVFAQWITMYKDDENDHFLIDTNEAFPVASNNPNYLVARQTNSENKIYTDFKTLHQSWARSDDEVKQKLRNWGHKNDFDVDAFYNFWKVINKHTYKYIRSFHPLDPWLWPSLEYFQAEDMPELIDKVNVYLQQKEEKKKQADKIKIRDFVPVALYKIKALFSK